MDAAELAKLQTTMTIVVTIANVALVLLTSIYVYLTRAMVFEMKASRDPSVFVDLEFPEMTGRIIVGNSGQSAAKNIRFKVIDNIPWVGKEKRTVGFDSIKAINDGLLYLPPGRVFKFDAGIPDWGKIESESCLLEIHVEYESENGKEKFQRDYVIDFSQYQNVLFESFKDPNREVAEAIRDTERSRRGHETSRSSIYSLLGNRKKACPMCAELIPEAAKKCSHCGEILESTNSPKKKSVRKKPPTN